MIRRLLVAAFCALTMAVLTTATAAAAPPCPIKCTPMAAHAAVNPYCC